MSPFKPTPGIAYPDEMKVLYQTFESVCKDLHVPKGSPEAERLAQAAMSLFQAGVSDETALRASLTEFLKRKP